MKVEGSVPEALAHQCSSLRLARKLGMPEYGQRFAENDISFSVLPDL
jgi:hypothetical protein